MGGDTLPVSPLCPSDSELLSGDSSPRSPTLLRMEDLDTKDEVKFSSKFDDFGLHPAHLKRILRAHNEVLKSYQSEDWTDESLEYVKDDIVRYTPGKWIENICGLELSDYIVPFTTSLLLIGPKGSGKSYLINRISSLFERNLFAPERAQVSYDISEGNLPEADGTYFLHEYMIPSDQNSFCLYDTRGLSLNSSENFETIKHWMTKGVRHGQLVIRDSDSLSLRTKMERKARENIKCFGETRRVNFVIFVLNAASVLEAIDDDHYNDMIASAFNCPFLSFKDDKPVVVMTHGDLLSLSERAEVRVHLGQLLGINPMMQIFDIPENTEPSTALATVEMLRYSLERADRNLPVKSFSYKCRAALLNLLDSTDISVQIRLLCVLWTLLLLLDYISGYGYTKFLIGWLRSKYD